MKQSYHTTGLRMSGSGQGDHKVNIILTENTLFIYSINTHTLFNLLYENVIFWMKCLFAGQKMF